MKHIVFIDEAGEVTPEQWDLLYLKAYRNKKINMKKIIIAVVIIAGALAWTYGIYTAVANEPKSVYQTAELPTASFNLRDCLSLVENSYQFDLTIYPDAAEQIKLDHVAAQEFCYKKFQ